MPYQPGIVADSRPLFEGIARAGQSIGEGISAAIATYQKNKEEEATATALAESVLRPALDSEEGYHKARAAVGDKLIEKFVSGKASRQDKLAIVNAMATQERRDQQAQENKVREAQVAIAQGGLDLRRREAEGEAQARAAKEAAAARAAGVMQGLARSFQQGPPGVYRGPVRAEEVTGPQRMAFALEQNPEALGTPGAAEAAKLLMMGSPEGGGDGQPLVMDIPNVGKVLYNRNRFTDPIRPAQAPVAEAILTPDGKPTGKYRVGQTVFEMPGEITERQTLENEIKATQEDYAAVLKAARKYEWEGDRPAAVQARLEANGLEKKLTALRARMAGGAGVPAAAAQPGAGQVAAPKTKAEYDKLPKGARYVDPKDGKVYTKGG